MTIEHFQRDYDAAKDHAWHLSCWLAPELRAWCVHDRGTGRLMAIAAAPGDALPQEARLPARPASVSFTAMPEISTLVPKGALEAGTEMRHLKLVHGAVPTGLLRDEPIATLGAHCIYLHDEPSERALLARFPGARSLPLLGTLVAHGLAHSSGSAVLVLHRTAQRLDLVVAERGRLLLSNTFHATAAEDVLYFTLLAVEQCGLKPGDVGIRMGGTHLAPVEELLLARYFARHPLPCIAPNDPLLAGLNVPDIHHWTGLTEQFPCAS